MPDRKDFLEALKIARNRMIGENGAPVLEGWNRKVLYHFSDTDEYWYMQVVDGHPQQPVQGEIDDPDVKIKMSSETFVGLMNGTINGMRAFTSGKVKVKASMADVRK
ncbi:MAG: hypothetical protein DRJ03_25185, partial [Chloroflexi bacterium]